MYVVIALFHSYKGDNSIYMDYDFTCRLTFAS